MVREQKCTFFKFGVEFEVDINPRYEVSINPKYKGDYSIGVVRSDISCGRAYIEESFSEKGLTYYLAIEKLVAERYGIGSIVGYYRILARFDGVSDEAVEIVRQAVRRLDEPKVTAEIEKQLLENLLDK